VQQGLNGLIQVFDRVSEGEAPFSLISAVFPRVTVLTFIACPPVGFVSRCAGYNGGRRKRFSALAEELQDLEAVLLLPLELRHGRGEGIPHVELDEGPHGPTNWPPIPPRSSS